MDELIEVAGFGLDLLDHAQFNYRHLVVEEIAKYSKKMMVPLTSALAESVDEKNYQTWGRLGIRDQLLTVTNKKFDVDFVLEGDHRAKRVLNAVSPAFTCSLPFASYV